jgi:hypothetical protein
MLYLVRAAEHGPTHLNRTIHRRGEPMNDQSFEGVLTARDAKRHIPHRFVVPAESGRLMLTLRFAPYHVHNTTNMLTLTLFDPTGFRGAGHRGGNQHIVQIGPAGATPGYEPGPLPPGEWIAQIDTHMIMPGEPVRYTLTVEIEPGTAPPPTPAQPLMQPASRGTPGWFRGDLHSHTDHSDANRNVADLVQAARREGLDFIFLTDHNTVSGLAEVQSLGDETLLTAGGIELTTFWGHALVLGARRWVDWRFRPGAGDITQVAAAALAHDQLFVIAHPQSLGDPYCTGCNWRYPEMMPGAAQLVEVWNGPWGGDSNNEMALALWYDWLNQGLRLVATAGTDTHGNDDYTHRPGFSVIYADELSEAALLRAVRAGRLYLSSGPTVRFSAQNGAGKTWLMGDEIDQPATLTVAWHDCPAGAEARLLANGRLWTAWPCASPGEQQWPVTPDLAAWYVVEMRAATGELLALTNPLFFSR